MNYLSNLFQLISNITAIFAVGFLCYEIESAQLSLIAFLFAIMGFISYFRKYEYQEWGDKYVDGQKALSYLVLGSRYISIFAIVFMISANYFYKSFPDIVEKKMQVTMLEIKKEGEPFELEIKYNGKHPKEENKLLVYLRNDKKGKHKQAHQENAVSETVLSVTNKIIGKLEAWLVTPAWCLFFLALSLIILVYPAHMIAKLGKK